MLCGKPTLAAYPGMSDKYYIVCEDFATEPYVISVLQGDHLAAAAVVKSRIQEFTLTVSAGLIHALAVLTLFLCTAAISLCDFGH